MPSADIPAPGWSFRASGNAEDDAAVSRVKEYLATLWADVSHGTSTKWFDSKDGAWQASAAGVIADAAGHLGLFEKVKAALSAAGIGTGSSEFTSPHVTGTNFHTPPAPAPGEGGGTSDSASGDSGDGGPAWGQ